MSVRDPGIRLKIRVVDCRLLPQRRGPAGFSRIPSLKNTSEPEYAVLVLARVRKDLPHRLPS